MIRLRVRVRGDGQRFRELSATVAPNARRVLVADLQSMTLDQVIGTTPVRTGRAKRAWGSARGAGDGSSSVASGEGAATARDGSGMSQRTATNSVPYVRYLEYGTRRMAPRAIVRRALERARRAAATLFSLCGRTRPSDGGDQPRGDGFSALDDRR